MRQDEDRCQYRTAKLTAQNVSQHTSFLSLYSGKNREERAHQLSSEANEKGRPRSREAAIVNFERLESVSENYFVAVQLPEPSSVSALSK